MGFNRGVKAILIAGASLYTMAAASPSYAWDDQEENKDETQSVDEAIVVTGAFQQSLIDRIPIAPEELPFTLNVTNRELLDERNYARPVDVLTTLPNITIVSDLQNIGSPLFLARGFSAPILVDNRKENAFRGSGARDDSFVDRYEVLRGPASISLGPVPSGGVINTVTKTPESERFVGFKLRADHFGSLGAEFDINAGDLFGGDFVQARVSGAVRNFEYDAKETKRLTYAIRPVLVFKLGEATALKTSIAYVRHEVNPNKGFPLYQDGSIPSNFDTDTFTGLANGEGVAEDIYIDGELRHNFLDNLRLTLRGSRQITDFNYQNTHGLHAVGGPPGIDLANSMVQSYQYRGVTTTRSTFFDAQLALDFDWSGRRQDFVVGGAYNKDSFNRMFSPIGTIPPFNVADVDIPRYGATTYGAPTPHTFNAGKLYSLFAETAIRPADWLTIVGGIRYDDLDQSFIAYRPPNRVLPSGLKGKEMTFRAGATAELTDGLNFYASYAESFNPQSGTRRDGSPVDAETSTGYEAGFKGNLFGNTLNFATAVFETKRLGVAVRDPTNVAGETFSVTIGKLRARGFEFSGDWRPVSGLNINLNYGHTDIDILEAGPTATVTSNSFPKDTASTFVTYRVPSGALEGLKFGGGARYVGKRQSNVPGISFDDYTVGDLIASYPMSDKLELSLNVQNFTNKLYLESAGGFSGLLNYGHTFGAPRTFVLTLRGRL